MKLFIFLALALLLAPSIVHAEPQNFVVYCPPMLPILGNYQFNPHIKLYQSFVEQNGELFVGGGGFTANSTASIFVAQWNESNAYVFTYATDRNGTFLESVHIGSNINLAKQKVRGLDVTTGTKTAVSFFEVVPAVTSTFPVNGEHFQWVFHRADWYEQNLNEVSSLISFADDTYDQYARDFGYSLGKYTIQVTNEADNMTKLYVGFASGSTLGISASVLMNDYYARSFISHEMANIFQGNVTGGWPWADGKGIWRQLSKRGEVSSPFPYAASVRVLQELGYGNYSAVKIAKVNGDCGFSLLWTVFQRFGWTPYNTLFNYLRQQHVNLGDYDDVTKNAVIMVLMSAGTGYDYISLFNQTFNMRGVGITQSKISEAYSLFNGLPSISGLQGTEITVSGDPTPVPEFPTWLILAVTLTVVVSLLTFKKHP